jgi:hypothetical protein
MLPYTGIGSREISLEEAQKASIFADYMAKIGMTLYTGDASGGDEAFHAGSSGRAVIWTPWDRHSGRQGLHINAGSSEAGRQWIRDVHPNPGAVLGREKIEPYLVRDAHQVIGMPPEFPQSLFVVYIATWVGGVSIVKGGTGQAVRIATKLGIPSYNLRDKSVFEVLSDVKTLLGAIK